MNSPRILILSEIAFYGGVIISLLQHSSATTFGRLQAHLGIDEFGLVAFYGLGIALLLLALRRCDVDWFVYGSIPMYLYISLAVLSPLYNPTWLPLGIGLCFTGFLIYGVHTWKTC